MHGKTQSGHRPKDVDPGDLPVRVLSGTWAHQAKRNRDPLKVPARAQAGGRYHRKGQEPRLYASSSPTGAWAEMFRHTDPESAISPFQVKRRMHRLRVVSLPVLDLTDPAVREALGVAEKQLTSNRLAMCRKIADLARRRPDRFGGILAPSAAGPYTTLVVFREWIDGHVFVENSWLGPPPLRLVAVYERVIQTLPPRMREAAAQFLAEIRGQVRERSGGGS